MHLILALTFCALGYVSGARFSDYFQTCNRSDPGFQECLRSSIEDAVGKLANGNKDLGIAPLEPLHIEQISVARDPRSSVSIDQKFSNIMLHGVSNTKIIKATFNLKQGNVYVEAFVPELRSAAEFEITGQLLIFPINGKGPSNVTLINLRTIHNVTGELYKKKGKDYLRVTEYKLTLKPEKIEYKFHNVLGGMASARISEEVHRVINDNSVSVFEEVRGATEMSYALIFQQIANRIFSKVPAGDIYIVD